MHDVSAEIVFENIVDVEIVGPTDCDVKGEVQNAGN